MKNPYPLTAKNTGMTDYTNKEFVKRWPKSNKVGLDVPVFPEGTLSGNVSKGAKKYICMVGKCSGVLNDEE